VKYEVTQKTEVELEFEEKWPPPFLMDEAVTKLEKQASLLATAVLAPSQESTWGYLYLVSLGENELYWSSAYVPTNTLGRAEEKPTSVKYYVTHGVYEYKKVEE
jgi:hypothetical protein